MTCSRHSHESIALSLVDYDWLHELIAPCPYDTSVQLASPCTQLPRCHIHAMRAPMYVRFTCPRQLTSRHKLLHAHGVNRLADRLVTPRHATSRLSQAEPAPALGPSGHLRSNSDRQIEHGLGRPLDACKLGSFFSSFHRTCNEKRGLHWCWKVQRNLKCDAMPVLPLID